MESLSAQERRHNSRYSSIKQSDHGVSPRKWHGGGPAICSERNVLVYQAIGAKALRSGLSWTTQKSRESGGNLATPWRTE